MHLAQHTRHFHNLLHRVIRALDDAARKEQALDAIATIEVERQCHHLVDGKARSLYVAGNAVDAIQAVVLAEIG